MKVECLVSDINSQAPNPKHSYFLDTNVILWMTYPKMGQLPLGKAASANQLGSYPAFISNAIQNNSKLYWCFHNIIEIAHLIEGFECDLYNQKHPSANISRKDYRDSTYNSAIQKQIDGILGQLRSWGSELECPNLKIDPTLLGMKTYKMGAYDYLILEVMRHHEITKIITDDADYKGVNGLTVLTANYHLIDHAKVCDRLY